MSTRLSRWRTCPERVNQSERRTTRSRGHHEIFGTTLLKFPIFRVYNIASSEVPDKGQPRWITLVGNTFRLEVRLVQTSTRIPCTGTGVRGFYSTMWLYPGPTRNKALPRDCSRSGKTGGYLPSAKFLSSAMLRDTGSPSTNSSRYPWPNLDLADAHGSSR